MAIDGSFSLHSSLRRFLDRCPKLQCFPPLESLERMGDLVTEEEVVNVLVGVFLHPSYTIPLMGCFRPIARHIVDKAVALLRLVPNLRSIPDDTAAEDDRDRVLDGVVNVIEFYSWGQGRGLDLHELACLAFCRALDMGPFLLSSVLSYFNFAPSPFARFSVKQVTVETRELHVAQISYRLLLMEPEIFSKLWDWSCFLDLVKDPHKPDLTWCVVQTLRVLLKLGYKATENLNIGAEEAFSCLLRWEEFCQDTSLEKAGWYVDPNPVADYVSGSPDRRMDFKNENCLKSFGLNNQPVSSPKLHELQPHFKSQRLTTRDDVSVSNTFVFTSAVKRSYDRVLLAVSQKWPVLLYGPSGSGKSALIAKLAQDCGNQVLSIQMDDQIDGRTLVGAYVSADRPGEFRWQPGSLTQAVQNGLWIVFEDINKAPSDLHSILMPLLEGAVSFATGHGEVVRVAESFRMFSTIAVSKFDTSESAGQNSHSVLWRRVMIPPLNNKDLQEIIKVRHPDLELHVGKLIETFERVNSISMVQIAGFHLGSSASVYCPCRFSLRDLLKWCKRIAGLGFCFDGSLSENQCFCVYKEAVDVFASFSSSIKNRLSVMKEIAGLWKVPVSAAETLYPCDKPIIQDSFTDLRIGRVSLQYSKPHLQQHKRPFVEIRSSMHVLERIACSVKYNEPVLLVGETGTGKTTIVQNLALRLDQKLTVLNLSQQSDVADLLGGFKPMDAQSVYVSLYGEFLSLFTKTFPKENNDGFITRMQNYLEDHRQKFLIDKNGEALLKRLQIAVGKSVKLIQPGSSKKRKRPLEEKLIQEWERFCIKLHSVCQSNRSSAMMFSFVEGSFVTALRNGDWVLLDEVNLAPPETLQRIIGVLEGEHGVLCLAERGDMDYIHRHPKFRIFACMNPATDAGKRDLPFSLRSRFTEYFVDDVLDDDDLSLFISQFISSAYMDQQLVNKIVCFYKEAKKESEERLQDGTNQKPQYSLRSLYRALEYTRKAERKFKIQKALYDGFSMFFVSLLDGSSAEIMRQKISSLLLEGKMPPHVHFSHYLDTSKSNGYSGNYVQTKSVQEHLGNLARAVLMRYPVLLQGPTSSGKTSLVRYLAAITGHDFVRINNHEYTDLQEYLGSYITDTSGKLVFNEGVLVKAVRNGYWIVLDELNLAPSDVLEALNRLLDDNRELYVPELQERIKADPNFMLFATQNPPTLYGGRKMLSRAFRNRFVEIHVGEIPDGELSTILSERCQIYIGHAEKMVEVMKDLRLHRQSSRVFAGKHGFMTPRDLFRWADRFQRFGNSYEDLAKDGYYLLAERLRNEDEKSVVQKVLKKHLGVTLNKKNLHDQISFRGHSSCNFNVGLGGSESLESVLLTKSMQRLYFLVERCYNLREPVLLVGETGGGKTTVCQLLSACLQLKLHTLNCHQYTETSDFIGGFRPIRERSTLISNYKEIVEKLKKLKAYTYFSKDFSVSSDINHASSTLDLLNGMIRNCKEGQVFSPDVSGEDLNVLEQIKLDLNGLHQKWQSIFVWQDGPLIKAMRDGDLFLVDEISLADDSVLERLNSVLEPERMLSLAEKGGSDLEKVTAHSNFFVIATMNPGGDYGKKELSPALRNRFTEIWVSPVNDLHELRDIALKRISKFKVVGNSGPTNEERLSLVNAMISFFEWYNKLHPGRMLTVRDLISWVDFLIAMEESLGPKRALLHGVFLVLLDGLNLGTGLSKRDAAELRERCLSILLQKLGVDESNSELSRIGNYGWGEFGTDMDVSHSDDLFGIDPFYINKGIGICEDGGFEFKAPTTCRNALRVLRAMQLPKPVLLEGSPGVGKTSLIIALGKRSGHRVVRINFSEQTDMMDLLGSDLPVESDEGMKFSWSDGILLQALKEGCWVLLDEINLAPQSVLEGLNAILDHRAEVFIPELGNTYKCPPSFRVFACQNPSHQGGGRKGLPKSFLNRFTKVYVDELVEEDYLSICESKFSTIPRTLLTKLLLFNKRMHEDTTVNQKFAKDGFPWEFNLRDVFRSCEIIEGAPKYSGLYSFLNIVYIQRMRLAADRKEVLRVFKEVFEVTPFINPYPRIQLNSHHLIVGNVTIKRNHVQLTTSSSKQLLMLPEIRQSLESAARCVERQWLCILTGPSCSGKTSLIRLLANLTGNVLNEVLDRINSLVEPCGSITVNERGIVDGNPLVIHPHPNFRIFLTVNPHYGEVSRAMRNRGVEIFMLQPYWLDDRSGYNDEDVEFKDVRRFLVLSGIPIAQLVDSMARAHTYAKNKGSELNEHITYLELSHWVHLFLQLLKNGCCPIWSLKISWEHIYLSSLGVEGEKIIDFAKTKYLSATNLAGYDDLTACPLALPGGWPLPLSVRDYVYYSKEASIKQNCMYLEFLGTQIASHQYRIARKRHSTACVQTPSDHVRAYLMDMMTLRELMFPKASNVMISDYGRECKYDSELTNRMLFFAANWTIEQATESDFKFYLLRFKWFSSQMQPFCQFFSNFVILIEQMIKHPIWEYISCRDKLDADLKLMPLLSLDLVDLAPSNSKIKYLCNAISCFDPLRLTYQQRNIESQHNFDEEVSIESQHSFGEKTSCFIRLLKSLYFLQDEILNKFVISTPKLIEDQSFDYKLQLYSNLIEDHALFWHYFISSEFDHMMISWHCLVKDARKFIDMCPEAVDNFLMESQKIEEFSFSVNSEKSLLWIHGGHPFLPSSSDLLDQQHQLLKFVETIWPRKTGSCYQGILSSHLTDVVASFDHDLRFLVTQDVSNSSFLMAKWNHEDGIHIVEKLKEMHQILSRRFEHEKHKLQLNTGSKDLSAFAENSAACCSFTPVMLCEKSVFEAWQDTFLPVDYTSLFWDMKLLQKLTSIHLDDLEELHQAVGCVSNLLDFALKFSLSFSSRPPQMFLPHQKILWTLNAWASVDSVNLKIASFILEMWFKWHESIWVYFPKSVKIDGSDEIELPHMLVEPFSALAVFQMTQSTHAIKEFWVQCLKSRVTSFNLWHCSHHGTHLPDFLLSAARCLFQQIIYAHRKSFEADQFARIKYIFFSEKNVLTEESIDLLSSLVASSRHHRLKNSVQKFIVPLLRELYLQSNTADFNYTIGCAWAHVGALRINLLLSCKDIDPAMKYYCKYSQLVETISSLELEIQVRKECGYLAGQVLTQEADKRKAQRLEKLQAECRKLQRKIVFRAEPSKYKKLIDVCMDFLKQHDALEVLVKSRGTAKELQEFVDDACSWQETATSFIHQLMDEYAAYSDIIQPIQVAVYEMKFGLSLVLSSTWEKKCLNELGQEDINVIMEMIYTLMRFPRAASCMFISVKHDIGLDMRPSYRLDSATGFYLVDVDLMVRLVTLSSGVAADQKVSGVHYRASVYWNILVQIAHCTANAKIIDDKSYMLMHKIFNVFAKLWLNKKDDVKSESDFNSQQYKFKPRAFEIESVIEVELPPLANSVAPETFLEWKEKSSDKIVPSQDEKPKQLEESIPFLSHVVLIHNRLFGSSDLVQTPGIFEVSDEDRLHSFIDSYTLGINLIRGVHSTHLPSLDAKLMPEHLFYLCLDYRKKYLLSHKSATRYNFYKDSNASEMAQMLKVLAPLQQQILSVLNEWEDHNDLQNFLDIIDMLLTLPSDTPLAKAFSGLQFLLHKAEVMQENGSKFSFSNQFKSVYDLLSSWQKIELDSWPALLDEVMDQYENNAGELWFPLYSVLQHSSCDISIIQSLEEFIQTSSIGEFRKRLQILFAFLGQNHISACLKINSSSSQSEQSTFLYNIFGFYAQFLPIVLKCIDASRKEVEIELSKLVKLCRWVHGKSYLSIESLKKGRQKLKKLIQKYTDILQEPVSIFFSQEVAQRGAKVQSFHGHQPIYDVLNKGLVDGAFDLTFFGENRFTWFDNCIKGVDSALQNLLLKKSVEEIQSIFRPCGDSQHTIYLKGWKAVWHTIEKIYTTAVDYGDLWKEEKKGQGKRRALSELLKLLESNGLSRHKSAYTADQHKSWWFLQLSGNIPYLLLTNSRLSCVTSGIPEVENKNSPEESFLMEWKTAIDYYFKSVVSVLLLQQTCLNPHKDITLEQEHDLDRSTARKVLIQHFQEIADKAKLVEEEFTMAIKGNSNQVDLSEDIFCERNSVELNARFNEALMSTCQHLATVLQNLCLPSNIPMVDESMVKIVSWESLFESFVTNLSLDILCQNLFKAISFGEKLVNCCDDNNNSYLHVEAHFRNLHLLMDQLLNFGDELMKNFLAMHKSVSVTTHVIANILASLFSKGFGISPENQEEDGTLNTSGDASGTGMGEGVGLKDVSDQITDEDQLLGAREQQNEKQDDSNEVPSSNNTGIEMEQDFEADAMSLSEDSGEDDDIDGENEELESEMGPAGPDSEAVGEKVCDENEDETPNDTREKYESGPSVKDRDGGNRELRAKDDSTTNEPGDGNCDEGDAQDDETVTPDEIGDGENADEVTMDKDTAYSDPTGLKPDVLDQTSDTVMDLDVNEDADLMEDGEPDEQVDLAENRNEGNRDEETCSPDEVMEEANTEVDVNSGKDDQENADLNSTEPKKDVSRLSELNNEQVSPAELASQSKVDWQTSGSENVAAESNVSNSHHDFDSTLLGGLPSSSMSDMDVEMPNSSNSGGFGENQPKSHHPWTDHSFIQEKHTNPRRSIGDALEYKKERVNVSGDVPEDNNEMQGEMEDENADEYGYVSEFEKGTTQALGPATLEQVDRNIDCDKLDKECLAGEDAKLQFEKEKSEMNSVNNSSLIPQNEKREKVNTSTMEKSREDGSVYPIASMNIDLENRLEDLVSFGNSYLSENNDNISQPFQHDKDLGKCQEPFDVPDHVKDNATALWRRFELSTTKLSHELTEQLRLVMEPTVASKLQGDYRTGKRINMKKVIPYIASDYSKDRIWLRRTRPNKRDYQVVIAVDDSHSMSENGCGDVAIEALVTVCRAVSQLEMGSLAVASFGTKGNIKLLHDFDRPFTGESGVKMISNLTFKQENTIADEPVVDLLKYLTNKLDTAVAKARLPSGHNPLQQLVLIIADGRFVEKKKLKQCVRDVSTGNRMVAFLLLDNSQESIMDLKEASVEGGQTKIFKYMDSFPFPYYIVLRNIEALPRTLANLLRQWMELMQHSTG
ncbi:hypothetical protein GLYMA_16G004800v4 [Glycine max]|nr:hypothetical protein GLYMA_16G004800v4 [Glycine max]